MTPLEIILLLAWAAITIPVVLGWGFDLLYWLVETYPARARERRRKAAARKRCAADHAAARRQSNS